MGFLSVIFKVIICYNLFSVVIICHFNPNVTARVIVAAQDRGMMEGDYAWFVYTDFATRTVLRPWTATAVYNTSNFEYRLTALSAVHLVSESGLGKRRYGLRVSSKL